MISIEISDDIASGCYRVVTSKVVFWDHKHFEERIVHDGAQLDEAIDELFAAAKKYIEQCRKNPPPKSLIEVPW